MSAPRRPGKRLSPRTDTGVMVVVPAPSHLKREDVVKILARAKHGAQGKEVFVVILCLGYDNDIADLFDDFDGNVAITTTTQEVLDDRARYNRLADRVVAAASKREGMNLFDLNAGPSNQQGQA